MYRSNLFSFPEPLSILFLHLRTVEPVTILLITIGQCLIDCGSSTKCINRSLVEVGRANIYWARVWLRLRPSGLGFYGLG
jgi:hypothetical protein